jgi:hypothetical protein
MTLFRRRFTFLLSFFHFYSFLRKSIKQIDLTDSETKRTFVVVISPWGLTAAPWFSIAVGLCLLKSKNKVQYIVDDLQFENIIDHKLQVILINLSLGLFRNTGILIERLSSFRSDGNFSSIDFEDINNLAFVNAIHKNRGEDNSSRFNEFYRLNRIKFGNNYSAIKNFTKKNSGKDFLVQGGIYSNSGLFISIFRKGNESFFTYDSGLSGVLMSSVGGIAAQLTDLPKAFSKVINNAAEVNFATLIAVEEARKRRNGTNKLNSQYQSYKESKTLDNVGILLPLNSPWDSAALNVASIFNSFNEWLIETIRMVLKNSSYNVTVRQHPDERHWWGKSSTDYIKLIYAEFGNESRIQFVSCYDEVNTYVLLERAEAVICYSSTIGIEAVIANKPLCVCSKVYYSNLGFAYVPSSKNDIVLFLKSFNVLSYNEDQLSKAQVAFYLGQHCNWLYSTFTPNYEDFIIWVKEDLQSIFDNKATQIYLESIDTRLPLSYINHIKSYNQKTCN